MSIVCINDEYHHMKVVGYEGEGREILVRLVCTVCGAERKAWIDAEEGNWTKKVDDNN